MSPQRHLRLNLASNPLRNRRMFYILLGLVVSLILGISFWSGYTFFRYRIKHNALRSTFTEINGLITENQKEKEKLEESINKVGPAYKQNIQRINDIIYQKSFSWVDFLSALENSLPPSCYIISLAPSKKENSRIKVRFKVASPHLSELLKFIDTLNSQKFKQVRVISEAKSEKGFLISEISFIYEKNV